MKRILATTMITGALVIGGGGPALAHFASPCNDTDGDGSASGQEYAQHHIKAGAHEGIIGQGHKPGSHMGFSTCNPSGR